MYQGARSAIWMECLSMARETGCSVAWQTRLLWEQEIVCSNQTIPTTDYVPTTSVYVVGQPKHLLDLGALLSLSLPLRPVAFHCSKICDTSHVQNAVVCLQYPRPIPGHLFIRRSS